MSRSSSSLIFDPINYKKRTPYAEGKPQGLLFGTIFGCPDNVYLKEKFSNSIKFGAVVGFNYGLFGTVLKDQPGLKYARDKFFYYAVKCGEHALRGALMAGGYMAVTTASSKLRGDKDDALNHFFGAYGLMAYKLTQGNVRGWLLNGMFVGIFSALWKTFYMNDAEFMKLAEGGDRMTNCRYPEMYIFHAKPPKENLK